MAENHDNIRWQLLQTQVRHLTGLVRRLEQLVQAQRRLIDWLVRNRPRER